MKKLLIALPILLFVSGASSEKMQHTNKVMELYQAPITIKLDSLNKKASELKDLIKKL